MQSRRTIQLFSTPHVATSKPSQPYELRVGDHPRWDPTDRPLQEISIRPGSRARPITSDRPSRRLVMRRQDHCPCHHDDAAVTARAFCARIFPWQDVGALWRRLKSFCWGLGWRRRRLFSEGERVARVMSLFLGLAMLLYILIVCCRGCVSSG